MKMLMFMSGACYGPLWNCNIMIMCMNDRVICVVYNLQILIKGVTLNLDIMLSNSELIMK